MLEVGRAWEDKNPPEGADEIMLHVIAKSPYGRPYRCV
jgi:hypothetical protein